MIHFTLRWIIIELILIKDIFFRIYHSWGNNIYCFGAILFTSPQVVHRCTVDELYVITLRGIYNIYSTLCVHVVYKILERTHLTYNLRNTLSKKHNLDTFNTNSKTTRPCKQNCTKVIQIH